MSFTTHREQLEDAERRYREARSVADKWRALAEDCAECAKRTIDERDVARALCGEAAKLLREVFYYFDAREERDARAEALVAKLEAVAAAGERSGNDRSENDKKGR